MIRLLVENGAQILLIHPDRPKVLPLRYERVYLTPSRNQFVAPLFTACAGQAVEILDIFFNELGASVNCSHSSSGLTPLHFVLRAPRCSRECVVYLLSQGATLNALDKEGQNGLHHLFSVCTNHLEGSHELTS